MSAKKSADAWLADFDESHQHPTNRLIHWICAPLMLSGALGLSWAIPVSEAWREAVPWFTWTLVAIILLSLFYAWLSPALSAGMMFVMAIAYSVIVLLELFAPWPLWQISVAAVVVAGIGELVGHRIEGRKPALCTNPIFLLIGPAWPVGLVFKRIGQRY